MKENGSGKPDLRVNDTELSAHLWADFIKQNPLFQCENFSARHPRLSPHIVRPDTSLLHFLMLNRRLFIIGALKAWGLVQGSAGGTLPIQFSHVVRSMQRLFQFRGFILSTARIPQCYLSSLSVAVVSIDVSAELKRPSVIRKPRSVQRSIDERSGVTIGDARWRGKTHSASPIFRRFRMNAAEDHPSLAGRSLDDRGRPVGILAHNRTPAAKLRAILPVVFKCWRADTGYRHSGLVDTSIHLRVKAEPDARRQIQAVASGISSQKSSRTDSQIVQTTLHGVVNVRGCVWRQAVADGGVVPTGNDHQTIGHEL